MVNEVIDELDLSKLKKQYKGGGTSSYHPRMMLKVLVYAYTQRRYSSRQIAKALRENISVVSEGLAAYETGYVTAMHDPTEGGLSGGLHEICDASRVGFEIYQDAIPIDESSRTICEVLDINAMELISSGSMVICCNNKHATEVVNTIQSRGISANIIGKIVKDPNRRLLITDSDGITLQRPKTDSLWAALKKLNP